MRGACSIVAGACGDCCALSRRGSSMMMLGEFDLLRREEVSDKIDDTRLPLWLLEWLECRNTRLPRLLATLCSTSSFQRSNPVLAVLLVRTLSWRVKLYIGETGAIGGIS